ncbi:MAG: hypothetical protein PHS79_04145 [Patescibacteria group bacterium]|nr:hypothetical protein [Patescibacteria group bacterium]
MKTKKTLRSFCFLLRVKLRRAAFAKSPVSIVEPEYFIPLTDAEAVALLVESGKYVEEVAKVIVGKYRKLAIEHKVPVTTPICYRVRVGYTLKTHAPKSGPCRKDFNYLQDWRFEDTPTSDSLVFWVPRILRDSTSKTKSEQLNLLAGLHTELELPAHHMSGFGRAGLVAGLILAHFKATGERVPLNQ